MNEQIAILVHKNPQNKVLHTALVGEMNGFLCGLTSDSLQEKWGTFGGPRAYTRWIQPAPSIPRRPADSVGGQSILKTLESFRGADREEAIATEIMRGNFPDFLRTFRADQADESRRFGYSDVGYGSR